MYLINFKTSAYTRSEFTPYKIIKKEEFNENISNEIIELIEESFKVAKEYDTTTGGVTLFPITTIGNIDNGKAYKIIDFSLPLNIILVDCPNLTKLDKKKIAAYCNLNINPDLDIKFY